MMYKILMMKRKNCFSLFHTNKFLCKNERTDYVVMMIYNTRKRISTGNERRNVMGVSEEHEE